MSWVFVLGKVYVGDLKHDLYSNINYDLLALRHSLLDDSNNHRWIFNKKRKKRIHKEFKNSALKIHTLYLYLMKGLSRVQGENVI